MKILVVDDSKAMRMIIRRTLKDAGFGAHALTEAGNGVEALAALAADQFDLVLSDWNMPEMSGIELLNALRADKKTIRFGFVTSESTPAMRELASESGADFLIAKPFTVDVFQQVLGGLLAA